MSLSWNINSICIMPHNWYDTDMKKSTKTSLHPDLPRSVFRRFLSEWKTWPIGTRNVKKGIYVYLDKGVYSVIDLIKFLILRYSPERNEKKINLSGIIECSREAMARKDNTQDESIKGKK